MLLSSLMTTLVTLGFSSWKVFEHFWSLALRLNNEHPNCLKAIRSDNGTEFKNASFDQFFLEHGADQQFLPRVWLNRMELWNERTAF
jgi:hypothetical protein